MPHGYLPQSVLEHIGSFCDEYDSIPFVPKLHALRIALKHARRDAREAEQRVRWAYHRRRIARRHDMPWDWRAITYTRLDLAIERERVARLGSMVSLARSNAWV